jgi:hypothetical protein
VSFLKRSSWLLYRIPISRSRPPSYHHHRFHLGFPHRSTLSRFLTALNDGCLDALRTLFTVSSFTWGWTTETIGGLWDRAGHRYLVFDIDGTREVARQRGLPTGSELPPVHRRLDDLCAPGYLGHLHGDVVRTRTTVLQMHTRQWLGSLGGAAMATIAARCSLLCSTSPPI